MPALALGSIAAIAMLSSVGAPSVLAAEHTIEIKAFKFEPNILKVRPGDRITWINRDIAPHTATTRDHSWDTKTLKRNETGSIVVTIDTKTEYYCRFHPHMKAKLIIETAR